MKRFFIALIATLTFPLLTFAQAASGSYLSNFIGTFLSLVKNILLPLAFAIAFLMFLINTARFFIIESASEDGRKKAKQSALLSILAFVFLLSLWTIVAILMNSLQITERDAACSDYILLNNGTCESIDGGKVTDGSFNGGGGVFTPPSGGSSGGGGGNSGSGGGGTTDPVEDPFFSGLAELIFGTGRDITLGEANTLSPAAVASTPTLSATASCVDAVATLKLAARTEAAQASYLFTPTSPTRWHNLTDASTAESVTFDEDELLTLTSNTNSSHLFHIHPDTRPDNLFLTMFGHGPSAADFLYACEQPSVSHHVVDETGIWTYSFASSSCPVAIIDEPKLSLIETYLALSMLEPTTREGELQKYIESTLTSSAIDATFAPLVTPTLADYSIEELQATSTGLQQSVGLTVTYHESEVVFCESL